MSARAEGAATGAKSVHLRCSLVCPAGAVPPKSADLEDVMAAAIATSKGGKAVAVVLVMHGDSERAFSAVDAAAWALERTL